MKILGIVGGTAPESTIEYYRGIVTAYRGRTKDGTYPRLIINSIDLKRMLDLAAGAHSELTQYLLGEVARLARAGAEIGLFAANTPHIVFEAVERDSPIPLISIVEATCAAATALGLRRVGILGTRFTMQARFYQDAFARHHIALVPPDVEEQDTIHERYMDELIKGVFQDATRERVLAIVDRLVLKERIEGVVLAGTELPLLLRDVGDRRLPFLDTTRIHVERAVDEMLR